MKKQCDFLGVKHIKRSANEWMKLGVTALPGFQLRYIFFIDKSQIDNLTVPVLPFSKIDEMGAGMYKGIKRVTKANSCDQQESGGAVPTSALHN